MTNPLDAGIPVLTEIIETPQQAHFAVSVPIPAPAPAPEIMPRTSASPAASASTSWDDALWQEAEHDMRERVLHQVMQGIDRALEQRVRDSLADVLQVAVERLAMEIRQGLHHSVKELVSQAVAEEIRLLKNEKQ
jgi:hypothetical protein